MRAKISVRKNSGMPLGYDYQYWLASMLLDRLDTADGELAYLALVKSRDLRLFKNNRCIKHYI